MPLTAGTRLGPHEITAPLGAGDYLVMELVEGETLAQRLEKGALPVPEALKLGAQIADALDRAHRAGVIHRDLKPGNVMLTRSGAQLMDFGLARATGLAGSTSGALSQSPTLAAPLTAEGTILGTFQYMAPEQLEGKEADARELAKQLLAEADVDGALVGGACLEADSFLKIVRAGRLSGERLR